MTEATEFDILQGMLPQLEAEGYDVFVRPNKTVLPPFLKDQAPDAIALKPGKNVAIEISRRTPQANVKLQRTIALFNNHPEWELRIVWVEPTTLEVALPVQTAQAVQKRIAEIQDLGRSGHLETSLLLGWATFEAVARTVMSKQFERPQTSGRLVQLLASEGYLTPAEADQMRLLADKRNKLSHGELQVQVSADEMNAFVSIIEGLWCQPAH